jgi:hypothetical protein
VSVSIPFTNGVYALSRNTVTLPSANIATDATWAMWSVGFQTTSGNPATPLELSFTPNTTQMTLQTYITNLAVLPTVVRIDYTYRTI